MNSWKLYQVSLSSLLMVPVLRPSFPPFLTYWARPELSRYWMLAREDGPYILCQPHIVIFIVNYNQKKLR